MRIGLCGLLALRLATTDFRVVAAQPRALFQPVSYMRLLGHMPSQGVAATLQIVGIAAALIAASGLALRASLLTAIVCSMVLNGMLNSTGRVIVGDAMLTLCLLVLLAAGSAAADVWTVHLPLRQALARYSGRPRPEPLTCAPSLADGPRYGWPVRTAMVTVALTIFFTGFQKLRYSGLAWVTSNNLRWILYAASDSSAHANLIALFIARRAWLAHLCAAGTVVLETGFPVVLFKPRLRWLFIPGMVALHVAVRLAMGLDYTPQALTVVIVFVDWPVAVAWLRSQLFGERAPSGRAHEMAAGVPRDAS